MIQNAGFVSCLAGIADAATMMKDVGRARRESQGCLSTRPAVVPPTHAKLSIHDPLRTSHTWAIFQDPGTRHIDLEITKASTPLTENPP